MSTFDRYQNNMLRLAILASGNGSNAQAIIEAVNSSRLDAEVKVVITNKSDAGVIARAMRFSIPIEIIPSKGFTDRDKYDSIVIESLKKYDVDTIALAGWMRILSDTFLRAYGDKIINIHPAILPSFTGGKGLQDAYEYGVKLTGCTVHIVSSQLDAGPIIIQAAVPAIGTSDEIETRVHSMEHLIFPQALQWFSENRLCVEGRKVILSPASKEVKKIDYVNGCLISPALEER
jgi:phosphoribosylglycinamide formyltransferase 1